MNGSRTRSRSQAAIDAEASQWLALRRGSPVSTADETRFQLWRAADPRHAEAYRRMADTLADIASLKSLAALEPLEPFDATGAATAWDTEGGADGPKPASMPAPPKRGGMRPGTLRRRGRWRLPAALAAAAAIAATVVVPGYLRGPDLDAATATAEIRVIDLPDGSRVTLGARSRLSADFDARERRLRLDAGEAYFEVAHDASRPFLVRAGDASVRVLGTKFAVNRGVDRVRVSVQEGTVEVREPAPMFTAPALHTLHAGDRIETAEHRDLLPLQAKAPAQVQVSTAPVGAWRQGQLSYDDTRLEDLVADLNRYHPAGIRLAEDELGQARLAASFAADEIDTFLDNLPAALPVRVSRADDGAILISKRR